MPQDARHANARGVLIRRYNAGDWLARAAVLRPAHE